MSGHSKWASIKHKKGREDAKRGKVFTKCIKEITVAARIGGGDPDGNPRLRTAIAAAKAVNMPADNVDRAIKKGSGELEGVSYEEISYEGYGPGGVAIMIEVVTDNKNRAAAEVRSILTRHNGNLGETNCVSWMFDKKGILVVEKETIDEDRLMEIALEAGADDVTETEEGHFEVYTAPANFNAVKEYFDKMEIECAMAEISMIPQNTVHVEGKEADQILRLMDALEDSDDVQNVYANYDIPEEILANFE